jgi:hypothetical protein
MCQNDQQRDYHPAFVNGNTGDVFNSTCVPEVGSTTGQCQVLPDGGKIKQADVILIYYPLSTTINASTKRHDLDLYLVRHFYRLCAHIMTCVGV